MIGTLTEPEVSLIVDALNGIILTEPGLDLRLQLRATVEDAMRLDGLDDKWSVDPGALLAKLDDLDADQIRRVIDGARRFWDAVGQGEGATPTPGLIARSFAEP